MKIKDKKTGKTKMVAVVKKTVTPKEPKLPKIFKEKWVAALRSGEYKQGKGYLQTEDGKYCCLGVACKITHPKLNLLGSTYISNKATKVPKMIINSNKITDKLANMNDDENKSFKAIATYIEKNL